jgi:hypothetical protein
LLHRGHVGCLDLCAAAVQINEHLRLEAMGAEICIRERNSVMVNVLFFSEEMQPCGRSISVETDGPLHSDRSLTLTIRVADVQELISAAAEGRLSDGALSDGADGPAQAKNSTLLAPSRPASKLALTESCRPLFAGKKRANLSICEYCCF